ncbi:hypothetical protein FB451DRAFT_1415902 [Mycena latifolia]|nr:hypothetical protein FB451DRAFT_1415902 [Mycena latifolia]
MGQSTALSDTVSPCAFLVYDLHYTGESRAVIDSELSTGKWIDEITLHPELFSAGGATFRCLYFAPGDATPMHRTGNGTLKRGLASVLFASGNLRFFDNICYVRLHKTTPLEGRKGNMASLSLTNSDPVNSFGVAPMIIQLNSANSGDEVKTRGPVNASHTPALDHAQRALCRILMTRHKLTQASIAEHCGWTPHAVSRAARNNYVSPDTVADDETVVQGHPELVRLMDELVQKQKNSGTPAAPKLIKKFGNTQKSPGAPATAKAAASKAAQAGASSSAAPSTRGRTHKANAPQRFLDQFVKGAALEPDYYDFFVAAELNEEGLRRMAHLDAAFLKDYLRGLVPESTESDRVLFVTADRRISDIEADAHSMRVFITWRPAMEQLVIHSTGVNGSVIRPALLYGRSESILAMLFKTASEGRVVWPGIPGGRYNVIHVDDLTDRYLRVAEKAHMVGGKILDAANPNTESANELLDKVVAISKAKGPFEYRKPTILFEEAIASATLVRPYLANALLRWSVKKLGLIEGLNNYYAA